MVLVIDNYDSFTYNLVQYLGELGAELRVRRNDEVTIEGIAALAPTQIVISPGPGRPEHAGVSVDVIRRYGSVWGTRQSAWPLAPTSCRLKRFCTASARGLSTTVAGFFWGSTVRSWRAATTRWLWPLSRGRRNLKLLPALSERARLWGYVIATGRSAACSFTRSPC